MKGGQLLRVLLGVIFGTLLSSTSWGQVSGYMFKDFNSNGKRDSTATYLDQGRTGSKVWAYDKNNNLVGTATTDRWGKYIIPNLKGDFRIEFEIPADYTDGFSLTGSSNQSSITFVTAPATNVDCGINYGPDHCGDKPQAIVSCFTIGSGVTNEPSIVIVPYHASGTDHSIVTKLNAPTAFTGSVWGTAVQSEGRAVFSAALMKRHAAFGVGGTGAIYITKGIDNPATSKTELYLDLTKFGIDTGIDPHQKDNYEADSARGNLNPFDAVGKISFGDMDVSSNGDYLFVVNLKERKLHRIHIGSPYKEGSQITAADIVSWDIPKPCDATKGESRPFGLHVRQDKMYIGVVCDASVSKDSVDLKGSIYEANPLVAGSTWKLDFEFPLNYRKGIATGEVAQSGRWYPWVNDWSKANMPPGFPVQKYVSYPTPIISDIKIDVEGSMMIALMDRFAHQVRFAGVDARGHSWDHYGHDFDPRLGGDLLRANRCGTARTWTLESNSSVCGDPITSGGNNGRGPDGGEFYYGAANDSLGHFEISQGSIAFVQGTRELMLAASDPIGMYSAGFLWLSNETGKKNRAYELLSGLEAVFVGTKIDYGKVNILGNVSIMCGDPPIEIGNRVWLDNNGNGIQDVGEQGVTNIEVLLINPQGIVVGKSITNARGEYAFNQGNVVDTLGVNSNTLGPQPFTNYTIRVLNLKSGLSVTDVQTNLSSKYALSKSNQGTKDLLDSDGILVGNNADIQVKTDGLGICNHSLDFGLCPRPSYNGYATTASCDTLQWVVKKNGKIRISNVKFADKVAFSKGTTFTGANYANAIAISSLKDSIVVDTLSNPTAPQAYTIRLYNGDSECYNDEQITLQPNTVCIQGCPQFQLGIVPASCDLTIAAVEKNGKILIQAAKNAYKVGFSTGTTYTGPGYSNAILVGSLNNGVLIDTLSNPKADQPCVVRLFNVNGVCYTDKQVTFVKVNCVPECDIVPTFNNQVVFSNKTPNDNTDDYFTVDINAINGKSGPSGLFEVVVGADASGLGGKVLNPGGTPYSSTVTVGYGKELKANNTNTKVVVRDKDYPACFNETNVKNGPWTFNCTEKKCIPLLLGKIK
jgi:SdrD B-like domain